jgi:hypothetical protein
MWEVPDPSSPNYAHYLKNPHWYMFNKPNAPSKAAILLVRDHVLEQNPDLLVVGAHLGSMDFAVNLADRISYFVKAPRADAIAFVTKYQDRLLYGTDNEFPEFPSAAHAALSANHWENGYASDWRFLPPTTYSNSRGKRIEVWRCRNQSSKRSTTTTQRSGSPGLMIQSTEGVVSEMHRLKHP